MHMRLKDGKSKVFTLSYDDGVVQDIRLINLMDQYGIKGTFNINSGCYLPEETVREKYYGRMKRSEAIQLFSDSGHEVASHAYHHPDLCQLRPEDITWEIWEGRKAAEADYGAMVRGMAYPYGTYNEDVLAALRLCGICYSRTTVATGKFSFPENWLTWHPTCHHNSPKLMELAERFVNAKGDCKMFYVWGHSYEFDNDDNWSVMEDLFRCVGNKEDIWYATNIEIYDYIQAYKALRVSLDGKTVYNPSVADVWFYEKGQTYRVSGGETIRL